MTCLVRIGSPRPTVLRAVVCGPCWAAHGGSPAAADVGPTPPQTVTSSDPAGQGQWLRALRRQPWVEAARVDARRNVLKIARLVALYAQWDTLESRPTWGRLIARSGLSERTVARWLQELRVRGWLAHLEHGSTPATRPMALAHLDGNRSALYGLRIPLTPEEALTQAGHRLVAGLAGMLDEGPDDAPGSGSEQPEGGRVGDKNGTLSLSVKDLYQELVGGFLRASTPVDNSSTKTCGQTTTTKTALRAGSENESGPDLSIMVPVSGYQMLACADWLRGQLPVFARCSRKLVRHLCKPYWRAGWCGRDIAYAMDHRPSVFCQPTRVLLSPTHVVSPAQFIRSRLHAWRTPTGAIATGYWAAKVADAHAAHTAMARVASRHGRTGAALLRPGHRSLTAERIAEHGRAVRAHIRARGTAAGPQPATPHQPDRSAQDDLRRAQLVAEARAELARHAAKLHAENRAPEPEISPPPGRRISPGELGSPPPLAADAGDTTSVYERAKARSHAENGRGVRRRTPRRRR